MSRRPIGDAPMSNAERSRRRRAKVKALRDAAPKPPNPTIQNAPMQPPSPAGKPSNTGSADYPRMLYHPDGRTTVAGTPKEHDRLTPDGWETTPLDIHR